MSEPATSLTSPRLVPAAELTVDELAEIFTRGYEGYFLPMEVDAPTMKMFIDSWDIDLARSRVALVDGAPVGVANLAVRGERAWVAGIGVIPAARRHGIGRLLMEGILAEAPPTVTLEVLEQNEPAIALYRRLGFETTRLLEIWSLTAELPPADVREVDAQPLGQDDVPWQRSDASLPGGLIRLDAGEGAVMLRTAGPAVSVVQLRAPDVETAAVLLRGARARGESLRYVNVPEGDVASRALAQLGGTIELRQLEMVLRR
jgi:ribosomal protein S18 acetylase RimI-like enzyme